MNNVEKLLELAEKAGGAEASIAKRIVRGEENPLIPAFMEEEGSDDNAPLYATIKNMTMGQKIKLALFGNKTARNILIRDPNKLVSLFVLQNFRITENEVVEYSRNKDLVEDIFREIAGNSSWMKHYAVKLNIVSNPKVPGNIALRWLGYILEADLKKLSSSKDIPQVIATQAKRLLNRKK